MSFTSTSLALGADDNVYQYRVQPMVVMSVLDHFKRRSKNQEQVFGTLLGSLSGDTITISNCFPVQHTEVDGQISIDMEFQSSMRDLYERVSQESVVGWYCTGSSDVLSSTSARIHELFADVCEVDQSVFLTVDTELTNSRLGVNAFTAETIANDSDVPVLSVFEPAPLTLEALEEDRIGVDALIQGQPDDDTFDSAATLLSESRALTLALENLHTTLADVSEYVEGVVGNSIKADVEVGRAIADCLSAVPLFASEEFEKSLNDAVSDFLSVSYLATLTKAQLALADKANLVA